MATYYLIVDNPRLYNQKGKVHANSPWNKPKGYRFEITGRPITSESGRLIMPLGDGTWLDSGDMRLVTAPPPPDPKPPQPPDPQPSDEFATAAVILQGNTAQVNVTTSPDIEVSVTVNGVRIA